MKVKSESEVAQSRLTLSDPMGYSLPGSSIHGIFQVRVLEWGAIAFSAKLLYYHPKLFKEQVLNLPGLEIMSFLFSFFDKPLKCFLY